MSPVVLHRPVVLAMAALTPACGLFGGLSNDNIDTRPVEHVIGTAAPLAYAATVAMAILADAPTPCAQVVAGCAAPPCDIEIDVEVGAGCHLPIGRDSATGRIPVSGTMSSPDNASLIALFQDIDIDGQGIIFRRGAFVVNRDGEDLRMTYGNQGLETSEAEVSVEQAGWTVDVDTAGTPGDTSDDTLELLGAQQTVINSDVTMVEVRATIGPGCQLNPIDGEATITAVSDSAGGVVSLRFHDDCDGEAEVPAAAGVGFGTLGGTVELDLFR